MIVYYQTGATRKLAILYWILFLTWVSASWFGLLGVGVVLIAASRWVQGQWARAGGRVVLDDGQLRGAWISPWALCAQTASGDYWFCRDEMPPADWAALLRWLYRHMPAQAVGLSMSK